MKARRAARELALILFSQMNLEEETHSRSFQEIILNSVRTLTDSAIEELENAAEEILSVKNFISNYEAEHPKNMARPIESSDKPVPVPMTNEMQEKLDKLLGITEKTALAVEIAEIAALKDYANVKSYIKKIVKDFSRNKDEIDGLIQKFSSGWDISRLVKMDKDILRIAAAELLFVKETPVKAVINEAVELAKKYSTEESASFVNGILGRIITEYDLK